MTYPYRLRLSILFMIADLGTQPWKSSISNDIDYKPTVWLSWELPDERMSDGKPFVIGEKYKTLLNEKSNISKLFKGWKNLTLDEHFRIKDHLGHSGIMNVVHNRSGDKTYVNFAGLSPLMNGQAAPSEVNLLIHFDLDDFDGKDHTVYNMLPQFIQKMISASPEYQEAVQGRPTKGAARPPHDLNDDVPFG